MKPLKTQWDGAVLTLQYFFSVTVQLERLSFQVKFPTNVQGDPKAVSQEFTSELWKWDVAELFIAGEQGRYIELNLAPNLAWWVESFKAKRTPDPEKKKERYGIRIEREALTVNMSQLESYLGERTKWRANVTGILNTPSPLFLSSIILPGTEPDFHQPEVFPLFSEYVKG